MKNNIKYLALSIAFLSVKNNFCQNNSNESKQLCFTIKTSAECEATRTMQMNFNGNNVIGKCQEICDYGSGKPDITNTTFSGTQKGDTLFLDWKNLNGIVFHTIYLLNPDKLLLFETITKNGKGYLKNPKNPSVSEVYKKTQCK